MKFGGTSVGSPERVRQAAGIVASALAGHAVVVVGSAFSGVTDAIARNLEYAAHGNAEGVAQGCSRLRERGRAMTAALMTGAARDAVEAAGDLCIARLEEICGGILQLRAQTPQIADLALSLGEEISAQLFAACLRQLQVSSVFVDSGNLVVTDARFGDASPDLPLTTERAQQCLVPLLTQGIVPVVTGYRGATPEGILTTLGRGGSDYSATILGAALAADEVWIWTDVDGVLTADPRICHDAATLPSISYTEAIALSHFGAKVIHHRAVQPAKSARIPVWIKNTSRPH